MMAAGWAALAPRGPMPDQWGSSGYLSDALVPASQGVRGLS